MAVKERNRNMKVEVKLIPDDEKPWNWKIFKQLNGHLRCKHVGQASLKQLPETQLLLVLLPSFSLSLNNLQLPLEVKSCERDIYLQD